MSDAEFDRRFDRFKRIEAGAFWFFVGVVFVIVVGLAWPSSPKDNTDPFDGRSDMRLHTDCLTGLQYLSARRGGITPRLDADGNHIIDRTGCDA